MANVFEYLGDIDSSVTYFIRALKMVVPSKNKYIFGTLNYNLASAFLLNKDYSSARYYAKKGYRISEELKDTHMMSNSLLDMGSIEAGLKNYDTAITYFDNVINLVKGTPDSLTILDALNNQGDVFAKRKEYGKALAKYEDMLRLAKQSKDNYYLMYSYGNLRIIIASAIKKEVYIKNYGKLSNDVYELALSFIIERAVFFLDTKNDNTKELEIIIEKRGKKEDQKLSEHYGKETNRNFSRGSTIILTHRNREVERSLHPA